MTPEKRLIVNADDFGLSSAVNEGIVTAHEKGIVTSASLMVRMPGAAEAARLARSHPGLSVGLHVDLGEWVCRDGEWTMLYEVVPETDAKAVAVEIRRQLDAYRRLMGREPTHLDSHQHAHRREPARSMLKKLAEELAVPLRHFHPDIRYCGEFYGQSDDGSPFPELISADRLMETLGRLSPGVTELACHPGSAAEPDTMYSRERVTEMETLCDPRVRAAIGNLGINLCSFHDWERGDDDAGI